jgi:uncharacterized iron-regulated membrane protein
MAISLSEFRRFWLNVHLWLGVGLMLLSVPIAISGGLLAVQNEVEELLHPARYTVSSSTLLQPSAYLTAARTALPNGVQATALRFPDSNGPVLVNARGRGVEGAPPQIFTVYLDPSNARVIDIVDFRASFFGFLHFFHENLTVPQYSGRAIVGWVGVAMLISSLSGIYLWWPRNGGFTLGLRWRRSPSTNSNLHHTLGFWISIPLAVISLTGIYLGFPQQGRDLLSSIAPLSPRPNFGAPARQTAMTPDDALAKALASEAGARPFALLLATANQGAAPVWRVQVRIPATGETQTVLIDDRTATAERLPTLAGDTIARWIRWIHEGSNSGPVWKFIVFLCGIFPPIFAFTGTVMWLRRRGSKRMRASGIATNVQAAE